MTTALPAPGSSSVEDHVAMSHRFLEHAKLEADKGNRLQASEKVWSAVAHALKSIGEKRGWDHDHHQNIRDISSHLGKEFNRRGDFRSLTSSASDSHRNFYQNEEDLDDLRVAIENAETFVAELDQLRDALPQPFTIGTAADQRRLGRLLGIQSGDFQQRLPIGETDSHGFSRNPDDNDHASPAVPPPGGPPPTPVRERLPDDAPGASSTASGPMDDGDYRRAGGCRRRKEALPNYYEHPAAPCARAGYF